MNLHFEIKRFKKEDSNDKEDSSPNSEQVRMLAERRNDKRMAMQAELPTLKGFVSFAN
jgi:hypothetical protein